MESPQDGTPEGWKRYRDTSKGDSEPKRFYYVEDGPARRTFWQYHNDTPGWVIIGGQGSASYARLSDLDATFADPPPVELISAGSKRRAPDSELVDAEKSASKQAKTSKGLDEAGVAFSIYHPMFRAGGPWTTEQLGVKEASRLFGRALHLLCGVRDEKQEEDEEESVEEVETKMKERLRALGVELESLYDRKIGEGCVVLPFPSSDRVRVDGYGEADQVARVRGERDPPIVGKGGVWNTPELQVSATVRGIYESRRVQTFDGRKLRITAAINPREGRHLFDLVVDNGFRRTCEVGMANGLSAAFLVEALQRNGGGHHVAIDPFQLVQWQGCGLESARRAGALVRRDPQSTNPNRTNPIEIPPPDASDSPPNVTVTWMESYSHEALPLLLRRGSQPPDSPPSTPEPFDLVFVDGMHLFDYTLVDMFYAMHLVRPGGVIVLDDAKHRGVSAFCSYAATNWPHLEIVRDTHVTSTTATFRVLRRDDRSWDFHAPFDGDPSRRKHSENRRKY